MSSAEAARMAASSRLAASIRTRCRTDEKTGDQLPDGHAAALGTDLRAILQKALHEHLETVSALFAEKIIRGHLLQHPHPFELVGDPGERYRRGSLHHVAHEHQGKSPTLLDGAHQSRVLLHSGAIDV